MRISLRDIEIGDLNNNCILIISKFARELHEHNGSVLKLNNPEVLIDVARHAHAVDNPQLKLLFQRLKLELRSQLNTAIPNHAEVGRLITQAD